MENSETGIWRRCEGKVVKLQGLRKEFQNLKLKLNENASVNEFCIRLIELINQMRISYEEIHEKS